EFTRSGSFPKAASLRGDHFEIPGDAFNLAQYRSVAGSLRADLNLKPNADSGRNFTVNFVATAVPLTTGLPPIDVDVLASGATSPRWDLSVQPLRWRNGDRDLELAADVNWPERGNLRVAAHHLGSELLQDFFRTTNAPVVLNEFALEAGWTNGPVRFSANASASMKSKAGFEFAFAMRASGDDQGIRLNQLSVSSATQIVCRAEGFLPFALTPANSNGLVQVSSGGVLELRAFTETNSALWEELGKKLPIKLANPMVRIDVSGTWSKPQGRVLATVQRLEMRSASSFPVVSDLNFDVRMDREMANARLEVLVQEQPVHASARLPLGRGFWEGLGNRRRLPDLRNATGELVVSDAKLAAFVDFAPKILAPQGELNIDVKLERGNKLFGHAVVYNAATRPLAPLGPLRAIDGELSFSGTELSVSNISAEIGGQRVAASGRAQIADAFWRERKLPEFQLHVVGTNVPLVRQASAVVRADLDLAITNSPGTNAVVSGRVGLHDSFYLSSLKDLAPGKVASPKRRPPYFSIEEEPFAGWRLGVSVEGEKFLKVQSPFFVGTVSTTLRLEGTLREPQALGEVRINSGTVTFPFGNLDVQQGFVSLTSADPYRPHLFVNAGAQRMGYEIKMEATGPADQPVVQFSSTPPLSSEQIVLMLTTGQMPQGVAASSARQRAQGLAMFVGKNILSDLGFGGSGDGRLTIRSAEQLTETGRPTYDVEYRLNK
ncbi:MAG TPA: translocation/assembly module TamB domain-containing protein, partial [Candidatus Paceibacterota bacterium]|nr:translocation/assembly module TamB domain-containing protein [Candidatus Paceibacterota bacterium]